MLVVAKTLKASIAPEGDTAEPVSTVTPSSNGTTSNTKLFLASSTRRPRGTNVIGS